MRLDGYVRVSRIGGREGEGYISPALQREAIESYAKELGGEIVAWQDDQDFTGGNIERPAFQAILERLRARDTDGIVVMKIDRFARSVADGATVVREIVGRDQVFAACHERIDPRTPEGNFMLNSFLNNAELFLNQSKAAWWTAKSRAIARGAHIGPTPIGYRREGGKLYPGPNARAMRTLFRRASTGKLTDTALARWMSEKVPRPTPWQSSEIRRWLGNRVYLGEVRYGDLVNTEAHEPLTDLGTWERCQREARVQRPGGRFLLSGFVRCASCRYSMGGQTHGGHRGQTPVYRCNGTRCDEPSVIVAKRLEDFVTGRIHEQLTGLVAEGTEGPDLDVLTREAAEAAAEAQAFASDLEARRLLGDTAWREALAVRVADRDRRVAERDQAFAQHRHTRIPLDELEDHLGDLLSMIRFVFVRRRRGVPAAERCLIVWADDTRAIDVPGPHRSGPFDPIRW